VELEPRTTAPAHATGAVRFVPLDAVADDTTFKLRDEGDVSVLASSIGRLGQLEPIELRPMPGAAEGGPYLQVVAGFRRLAALRLLARDRMLARVHFRLDDEDAWALALAQALLGEPLLASELDVLRERLAGTRAAQWAAELFPAALARAPVDPKVRERIAEYIQSEAARAEQAGKEEGTVEVTPDELAHGLAQRMYEVNQDLAVAFESWAELPPEGRRMIVEQARYVSELLTLLKEGEG
jgi:ParB-like chromosome segregation protein Spo0J